MEGRGWHPVARTTSRMGSTSFVGTGTTVGRPPFMVRSSFLVFVVFLIAIFVFELCRELGNLLLKNRNDQINRLVKYDQNFSFQLHLLQVTLLLT